MVQRVKTHEKIELVLNVTPKAVLGGADGKVHTLQVTEKSGSTRDLGVKCVFVAIGHVPNSQAFTPALAVDEGGYFVAAANTVSTQVPGVFVAGDCADHVYRQAITAAGMGCRAAIEAERWLAGH
jgi:thioredoxin reductase (NADPH)